MFQQTTPKFKGDDLLTKDIQRSRDTGLPPYNKMRSVCGIPEAKTFDDLIDLIAFEVNLDLNSNNGKLIQVATRFCLFNKNKQTLFIITNLPRARGHH